MHARGAHSAPRDYEVRQLRLDMDNEFFGRPILNSPYNCPSRDCELDPTGQPSGRSVTEHRAASFLASIPSPASRAPQKPPGFDETARALETDSQQYELMALINWLRRWVDEWRKIPDPAKWRVTAETARLLEHWRTNLQPSRFRAEPVYRGG